MPDTEVEIGLGQCLGLPGFEAGEGVTHGLAQAAQVGAGFFDCLSADMQDASPGEVMRGTRVCITTFAET